MVDVMARPGGGGPTGPDLAVPARRTVPPALVGLAVFVAYLVPAVVAYVHVWAHPATVTVESGAGDPAQYAWYLRWVPWAVAHGHDPFVSHWINVPFGVNLVDNTAMFALGFVTAPITAIWGPVASLNVLFTLAFPLSAGAGYLLARRFTEWRPAAFAAGLLYGFSPYMVGQGIGHLNLIFVPLPPLIFLALHELLVVQRGSARRWGAVLAGLVVLQFLISSEVLATTALFAGLAAVVVALAARHRVRDHLAHAVTGLVTAGVIAVVVLAFPLYELARGPEHLTGTVAGYHYYYSALVAPLLPTRQMLLGTAHLKAMGALIGGNGAENGTYLGLPLVVVAVVGPFVVRRRAARVAGVMALVAFVLSLGVRLHVGMVRFASFGRDIPLPGAVLSRTPLLDQAFPVRYSLFVALFVSVVLALVLDALHRRRLAAPSHARSARRVPWPAVVAVVALVPLVPAWPYPAQGPIGVPAYFTGSAVHRLAPGTVAVVYPIATNADTSPMLWQAEADLRFRMVGGYFVLPVPGGTQFYTPTETEGVLSTLLAGTTVTRTAALRRSLRAQWRSWHVGALLAQDVGGAHPISFFTWLLGRPPDARVGGLDEWYGLDGT